jgi:hypothetical protein
MSLVPETKIGKIQFFNSKITPWTKCRRHWDFTAAAVTDLQTKLTNAQTKLDAQIAAEAAFRTAVAAANDAVSILMIAGMDIVKAIRAKAAVAGNSVYELAEIPAPATPTPVNTLGKPSDFVVTLSESGALDLTWKCASPRATGVIYQIWRRIGPTGAFDYLGGTGEKKFTDSTLPAGSSQVTYQIQAVRSTAAGRGRSSTSTSASAAAAAR